MRGRRVALRAIFKATSAVSAPLFVKKDVFRSPGASAATLSGGEWAALHLNEACTVLFQPVDQRPLHKRMVAAYVEHAVAAEEVEIFGARLVPQPGALGPGEHLLEAN